jgi:hypothetical protein
MILLSALPKNSLGIIKALDTDTFSKEELTSLELELGARVRVKGIKERGIVLDIYSQGNKKRINVPLKLALKISVIPL